MACSSGSTGLVQCIAQSPLAFDALPPMQMIALVGYMHIQSMIRAGFAINLFGVTPGTVLCHLLAGSGQPEASAPRCSSPLQPGLAPDFCREKLHGIEKEAEFAV